MKKVITAVAMMASLLSTGCTTRFVDFTTISSKNVDMSKGADFIRGKQRVTGEDKLDGVISTKWWYIPYVYGEQTILVEGTPLIDPKLK